MRRALTLPLVAGLCWCVLVHRDSAHADNPPGPSSIEEIPSASREDVVRTLADHRRKYGEHAVVIMSQLLVNAMRNGSLLATAVGIEGVREYGGKRYLGFNVETGMIFDDLTRDQTTRVHMLWSSIAVPTLERLRELQVPADGLKLAMQYHHKPYRSQADLRAGIDHPGTSEEACFYLLTPDVADMAGQRLTPRSLLQRARITLDGAERIIEIPDREAPTALGPD